MVRKTSMARLIPRAEIVGKRIEALFNIVHLQVIRGQD
jgi:hypothetical protein